MKLRVTGNHACFILVILNCISLYTSVLSTFQQHLLQFPTIKCEYISFFNWEKFHNPLTAITKSPVPMQIDLLFFRNVKDTSQKLIFIKLIID